MKDFTHLFPNSYEASRERFRENLKRVREIWPDATLNQYVYDENEDLSTDWIRSEALDCNDKVFILTTGEHGIEGYVGSAMLQYFIDNYLPRLDPSSIGILLVHAINPWGMKHHRRTNSNNVDLNRNFVWEADLIDPAFNPDHKKIDAYVNPSRPITNYLIALLSYFIQFPRYLLTMGFKHFKKTSLLGQYHNPKGVHYGGTSYQLETQTMIELYRQSFQTYNQVLHLDMHTGYGPRYQMSLVNSVYEKGNSQYFSERFNYPLVVTANTDEFYNLRGDMIDFVYAMQMNEFPDNHLYSNSFEFGCFGSSISSIIRTFLVMTLENQAFCFGTASSIIQDRIENIFREAFYPSSTKWREKAVADADCAFKGILSAEGYK